LAIVATLPSETGNRPNPEKGADALDRRPQLAAALVKAKTASV